MQLRILTDTKEYEFVTKNMEGRLNDAMDGFEFKILVSSFRSISDSSDLKFVQRFANGNEIITINALLPDDKDGE